MFRRGSSSEETDSTTTASRRGSEDSDSGVGNLSERDTPNLGNSHFQGGCKGTLFIKLFMKPQVIM